MSVPISLNSPQYTLTALGTSSDQVVLGDDVSNVIRVIVDNSEGTTSAFVTGSVNSTTAVFPTSKTVASAGAVVAAGSVQTYEMHPSFKYIAAIRSSGSANLYIKIGSGD